LRRKLANGEITREAVEQIIEGQHWQIQQLVLPDLHQDRERTFPEGCAAAHINIPDAEVVHISDDDIPIILD